MGGKAPKAPNPYQVAAAQTQSNLQTAQEQAKLNAVDQSTPFGSVTFQRDANGDPTGQNISLSPQLQQLLQQQYGLGGQIGSAASTIAGNLPTGPLNTNFNDTVQNAANSAYGALTNFLNPQFAIQTKQLNSQLDNRGLPIGSEARNDATTLNQNNQNLAYTQAADQAYGAGLQAQNQGFNQAAVAQQLPFSELGQLSAYNPSSSLISRAPSAINTSTTPIQPTNVSGDVYNSANLANQQYMYNQSQLFNGALGLGALLL